MSVMPVDGTDDDDFGAMFEASLGKKPRRLKVGDKVRGSVSQVARRAAASPIWAWMAVVWVKRLTVRWPASMRVSIGLRAARYSGNVI